MFVDHTIHTNSMFTIAGSIYVSLWLLDLRSWHGVMKVTIARRWALNCTAGLRWKSPAPWLGRRILLIWPTAGPAAPSATRRHRAWKRKTSIQKYRFAKNPLNYPVAGDPLLSYHPRPNQKANPRPTFTTTARVFFQDDEHAVYKFCTDFKRGHNIFHEQNTSFS